MNYITATAGRFTARVILKCQGYGMNDALINQKEEPLVEFYDNRQDPAKFDEHGQFIARYYLNTLTSMNKGTGLTLVEGIPDWVICEEYLTDILDNILTQLILRKLSVAEQAMKSYKQGNLKVTQNISGCEQESSFANATLNSVDKGLVFSVAICPPKACSFNTQCEIEEKVREDFQSLVDKGWNIEVQIGNNEEQDLPQS